MVKKRVKSTPKTARKIVPILKIGITSTSASSVLRAIMQSVENGEKLFVVTPNPEIVLRAQNDSRLAEIINNADFALPDGRGLAWAVRYLYGSSLEVIPGRIIAQKLAREANRRGWRVFLLGRENGPWLDERGEPADEKQRKVEERVIGDINKKRPQLLFVGFGAPKQEKWLARNLPRLKVNLAMTVGGTFDYWAGKVPLPPPLMEKLGLEWLWRLLTQPRRAPRIFRAVVIFPLKVIWYKKFGQR